MVYIPTKSSAEVVKIPKNQVPEGDLVLTLHSELTNQTYTFNVTDEGTFKRFYKFTLDLAHIPDGEYTYNINGSEEGLLRLGDISETVPETIMYNASLEVIQYTGYNITPEPIYSAMPLTLEVLSAGTFVFNVPVEVSFDGNEWIESGIINVVAGDELQVRKDERYRIVGMPLLLDGPAFNVKGNIMSLAYPTDYVTATTIPEDLQFAYLFSDCISLISAENLVLQATELKYYCYKSMFWQCVNLKKAPKLPATTLASMCYYNMFYGCTSLTTAPELPATTLANICYSHMFENCTSLTTAPELPATTLADNCYISMFQGCTSLTEAPELPATTLASTCYYEMFRDCTNLTTAPALPATTLASECYREMFRGCTSLTQVPSTLPATTLTDYCYQAMFSGCTSLTTAPVLPATTLVNHCYQFMFQGCTSLNYIKCLATDISANSCTNFWVSGVAASGTFVKNASMSSWRTGSSNGIPRNWTVEEE